MIKKIVHKCIALGAVLAMSLIMLLPAQTAQAFEQIDLKRTGSISVTIKSTDTGKVVPGGEISVYKVADVAVTDTGYQFQFTGAFSECTDKVSLSSDLTAALASKLEGMIGDAQPAATKTVGSDGTASFTGLPVGMYLVVQTSAAENYAVIDPFLVTLPYTNADGSLSYTVDATPKAGTADSKVTPTPSPKTPKKTTSKTAPSSPASKVVKTSKGKLPQTGQLWWPVFVMAGAGAACVLVGLLRRSKNN